VSDRRKVGCKQFQLTHEKGAVVLNVLYKRDQCAVELYPAWSMWSRNLTPSPRASPPLLSAGHWRFSLLVALNNDGPGQCNGYPQAAQPRTCGPWRVYVNIVVYFSSSNTVFWNVLPNDYLHSTDYCYIF
jgi:hypothetical protein